MKHIAHSCLSFVAGVLAGGLVSASSPALAQAGSPAPEASEQVMITSPYVIKREAVTAARAQGVRNPELVSLSRPVSYSDLDMSKSSDVAALQQRARNTARDVCQDLTRLYPRGQFIYANDCVQKATDDAMATIKQIADAAATK